MLCRICNFLALNFINQRWCSKIARFKNIFPDFYSKLIFKKFFQAYSQSGNFSSKMYLFLIRTKILTESCILLFLSLSLLLRTSVKYFSFLLDRNEICTFKNNTVLWFLKVYSHLLNSPQHIMNN